MDTKSWGRRQMGVGMALALGLSACGPGGSRAEDAESFVGLDPAVHDDAPSVEDVDVIESSLSPDEAEALFMRVLQGETEHRLEAIAGLRRAARDQPENARAHLLLGLARLSALAEDGRIRELLFVEGDLKKAEALAPEDRRIPAWRLAIQLQKVAQPYRRGLKFLRPQVDARAADLIKAAEAYPEFIGFSAAISLASLPHETGYPKAAREWVDLLTSAPCPPEFVLFCGNTPLVPHNVEGALLTYGDVYARAGDVERARELYESAAAQPSVVSGEWRFTEEVRERVAHVADRVARWTDSDDKNDPTFFFEGKTSCVGCHGS